MLVLNKHLQLTSAWSHCVLGIKALSAYGTGTTLYTHHQQTAGLYSLL